MEMETAGRMFTGGGNDGYNVGRSGICGARPTVSRGRSIPTVRSALRKMQTSLPAREQSRQRP